MNRSIDTIVVLFIIIVLALPVQNAIGQHYDFDVIGYDLNGEKCESIEVINSEDALKRGWNDKIGFIKPTSKIDFENDLLVAICRGQCGSGGYGVHVDSIYKNYNSLIIEVVYTNPADNCHKTYGLTSPCILIKIKNEDLQVVLNKSVEIRYCN